VDRSEASPSFLRIKDYLTMALLSLVELSMLFLLPQNLHVPQNSLTRVAVLICADGSAKYAIREEEMVVDHTPDVSRAPDPFRRSVGR
jgi:hypothetical protein